MLEAEIKMKESKNFLKKLDKAAFSYLNTLTEVFSMYEDTYNYVHYAVTNLNKTDWSNFSKEEKIATHNMVLLVGLLYKMCQVQLLKQSDEGEMNTINEESIQEIMNDANSIFSELNN